MTTYDVEGLRTLVSISREPGGPDDEVTLTGRLRTVTGDPIPHATMILERRDPDSRVWKPVLVAEARNGIVRATVQPDESGFYRWRFVERPLAEGNASAALLLDLLPTPPTDPPTHSPTDPPTSTPSGPSSPSTPSNPSTPTATDSPSEPSSPSSASSTGSPSESATESLSESPSDPASHSASQPASESGKP